MSTEFQYDVFLGHSAKNKVVMRPLADCLRFQFGTLKRGQNIKYLPHVFTQEGVAMLS
jgi:hypothetical protein